MCFISFIEVYSNESYLILNSLFIKRGNIQKKRAFIYGPETE